MADSRRIAASAQAGVRSSSRQSSHTSKRPPSSSPSSSGRPKKRVHDASSFLHGRNSSKSAEAESVGDVIQVRPVNAVNLPERRATGVNVVPPAPDAGRINPDHDGDAHSEHGEPMPVQTLPARAHDLLGKLLTCVSDTAAYRISGQQAESRRARTTKEYKSVEGSFADFPALREQKTRERKQAEQEVTNSQKHYQQGQKRQAELVTEVCSLIERTFNNRVEPCPCDAHHALHEPHADHVPRAEYEVLLQRVERLEESQKQQQQQQQPAQPTMSEEMVAGPTTSELLLQIQALADSYDAKIQGINKAMKTYDALRIEMAVATTALEALQKQVDAAITEISKLAKQADLDALRKDMDTTKSELKKIDKITDSLHRQVGEMSEAISGDQDEQHENMRAESENLKQIVLAANDSAKDLKAEWTRVLSSLKQQKEEARTSAVRAARLEATSSAHIASGFVEFQPLFPSPSTRLQSPTWPSGHANGAQNNTQEAQQRQFEQNVLGRLHALERMAGEHASRLNNMTTDQLVQKMWACFVTSDFFTTHLQKHIEGFIAQSNENFKLFSEINRAQWNKIQNHDADLGAVKTHIEAVQTRIEAAEQGIHTVQKAVELAQTIQDVQLRRFDNGKEDIEAQIAGILRAIKQPPP